MKIGNKTWLSNYQVYLVACRSALAEAGWRSLPRFKAFSIVVLNPLKILGGFFIGKIGKIWYKMNKSNKSQSDGMADMLG